MRVRGDTWSKYMTFRCTRRSSRTSAMSYAGWLLAELSLILMIVMIGSETPLTVNQPEPTRTSTPTPTVPSGLSLEPLEVDASMAEGAEAAAKSIHEQIKESGVRPAFILLWGVGNSSKDSQAVKPKLGPLLYKTFEANPLIRAYYHPPTKWKLGRVYAEVFYFND